MGIIIFVIWMVIKIVIALCEDNSGSARQYTWSQYSTDGYGYGYAGTEEETDCCEEECDLDACYSVLGITAEATDADVKRAYRELVKRNHPDIMGSLGEENRLMAERRLQEINEAYEIVKYWRGMV